MPIPSHYIDSYQLKDKENNKFVISKLNDNHWIVTKNISLGSGKFVSTGGEEIVKFKVDLSKKDNKPKDVLFKTAEEAYNLVAEKYALV